MGVHVHGRAVGGCPGGVPRARRGMRHMIHITPTKQEMFRCSGGVEIPMEYIGMGERGDGEDSWGV